MILTPATAPPPLRTEPIEPPEIKNAPVTSSHGVPAFQPYADPIQQHITNDAQEDAPTSDERPFLARLSVPTVVLDTQTISHTMAAALSLTLLGHMLYLKSQVPLYVPLASPSAYNPLTLCSVFSPVAQLTRMPGGRSNPKAAKKRDELLATFDLLTSHLHTTFIALSTVYARCKLAKAKPAPAVEDENARPQSQTTDEARTAAAHLMFVMGPSPNAARARILLTIDGLEVKVWGARVDAAANSEDGSDEDSEGSEQCDPEDGSEESEEEDVGSSGEDELSEDEDGDSEEDAVSDAGLSDPGSEPPSSRSPSPSSPLTRSLAPSPESIHSPSALPNPLPSTPFSDIPATHPTTTTADKPETRARPEHFSPPPPSLSPPASRVTPQLHATTSTLASPAPQLSYAEEQRALRAAERLLSRTLMNAWVDSEGDMSTELGTSLPSFPFPLCSIVPTHANSLYPLSSFYGTQMLTPTACTQPRPRHTSSSARRAASPTPPGPRARTSPARSTPRSPPRSTTPAPSRPTSAPTERGRGRGSRVRACAPRACGSAAGAGLRSSVRSARQTRPGRMSRERV